MYNLPNITVKELYELPGDEYKKYMALDKIMQIDGDRFLRAKAKPLGTLQYGHVIEMKHSLKNIDLDALAYIFKRVYGIKKTELMEADVVSYFLALKWILKEFTNLVEKEKKVLTPAYDIDLDFAGVKRLNGFGEMGTLINLARSFNTTPQVIEAWQYNLVFTILAYDKVKGEIQTEYSKLKQKK